MKKFNVKLAVVVVCIAIVVGVVVGVAIHASSGKSGGHGNSGSSSSAAATSTATHFSLPETFPAPATPKPVINTSRGSSSWVMSYRFKTRAEQLNTLQMLFKEKYTEYGKNTDKGHTTYSLTNNKYVVTLSLYQDGKEYCADYAIAAYPHYTAPSTAKAIRPSHKASPTNKATPTPTPSSSPKSSK